MEKPTKNKLLIVTEDQFRSVRKFYNVTKESLDRDVTTLIEWVRFQPHLPKIELDRDWVERVFIINKCYMEKTKKCIDSNLSARVLFPEFYFNRNPKAILESTKNSASIFPLSKLSKDLTRVFIVTCIKDGAATFDIMEYLKLSFMILDYMQYTDYCLGSRIIFDMKHIKLEHYLKMYPAVLIKSSVCNEKVVGARMAGYHFLYPSAVIDSIISLGKVILPEKQKNRMHVHNTFEDLHEHISKEILPAEYGGDEKSKDCLLDEWKNLMMSKSFSEWNGKLNNLKSDENKRHNEAEYDENLGIPGSFRTLTLD